MRVPRIASGREGCRGEGGRVGSLRVHWRIETLKKRFQESVARAYDQGPVVVVLPDELMAGVVVEAPVESRLW
jgi:hypothetical protein